MQRIGLGFDVHAFAPARQLILGGVHIPYEQGLAGHSDADVLVHAIMDALLSAARLGDIGQFFPDTDPAYEGADSLCLLKEVIVKLDKLRLNIVDIDSVLMIQEPKISPYRIKMRENIAAVCHLETEQVGVKATTTEHLGFVGQKQGVAAAAVVLLSD